MFIDDDLVEAIHSKDAFGDSKDAFGDVGYHLSFYAVTFCSLQNHAIATCGRSMRLVRKPQPAGAGAVAAGNSIQKRLPSPDFDSSPTRPFIRSIPLRTIAKPIPVPG